MRYASIVVAALLLSLVGFSSSSAGEKVQGDMVSPYPAGYWRDLCNVGAVAVPPSPDFAAGVSKAKFKFTDRCKGKIVLKKLLALPVSDGIPGTGDEVYCLLNVYDSLPGVCGTFVVRGEVSGAFGARTVKIKINGPAELPGVCPPPPATNFHVTSVECYMPDPGFSAATACTSPPAAGSYTPFASDATQGLCFPASSYVPNSGTPALAVQGVTF